MTVLIPNARITARWHGALDERLRHTQLELFLRSRGARFVVQKDSRITDNIATATLCMVNVALVGPAERYAGPLAQSICGIAHAIATSIDERASWRIAALVSIARLFAPGVGIGPAAKQAATATRAYAALIHGDLLDAGQIRLCETAKAAVETNGGAEFHAAVEQIAARLSACHERATDVPQPAPALIYEAGSAL